MPVARGDFDVEVGPLQLHVLPAVAVLARKKACRHEIGTQRLLIRCHTFPSAVDAVRGHQVEGDLALRALRQRADVDIDVGLLGRAGNLQHMLGNVAGRHAKLLAGPEADAAHGGRRTKLVVHDVGTEAQGVLEGVQALEDREAVVRPRGTKPIDEPSRGRLAGAAQPACRRVAAMRWSSGNEAMRPTSAEPVTASTADCLASL
mgnify:CR=1 FL=1